MKTEKLTITQFEKICEAIKPLIKAAQSQSDKPVVTEEELYHLKSTIALLSSMIDGGEVHSHESVLMKKRAMAILTKLNQ